MSSESSEIIRMLYGVLDAFLLEEYKGTHLGADYFPRVSRKILMQRIRGYTKTLTMEFKSSDLRLHKRPMKIL